MIQRPITVLMLSGLVLILLIGVTPAAAHGVEITYALTPVQTVRVEVIVHDLAGEPVRKADVTVFTPEVAPGDAPAAAEAELSPWLETSTDRNGWVSFVPDPALAGSWQIAVAVDDADAHITLPLAEESGLIRLASDQGISVMSSGLQVTVAATPITTIQVALHAQFDTGEAMDEAQVVVYAPDNPQDPFLTGTCDAEGRYAFAVDLGRPGVWEIQVRKAGHGDWLKIDLDENAIEFEEVPVDTAGDADSTNTTVQTVRLADEVARSVESDDGLSSGQIVLMSATTIWGFVGTALYFSRRRAATRPESESDN
ncbi:MAG: hypothetical protein GYB65_06945 [Chloroflexi bacterium]|nr:hypothetical protein [Chloroflexota bacterium]